VEEILGDRDSGLDPLRGGKWDAVIDVNGYVPRLVRDSTRVLSDLAARYIYISTLSVLADPGIPNQDEKAPRASFDGLTSEEITKDTYGPLKAACEAVVESGARGRWAILRPGFIVGPWDHTGRFNYWLRRASEGGEMLAPGNPASPVQFIDARDLALFTLLVAESKKAGIYHAVGPRDELTWGGLFDECRKAAGKDTRVVWVSDEFLDARGIGSGELPMRFRGADGLSRTNRDKAMAEGLTFRPLRDTIQDTLAWDARHGRRDVGLSPDRERELLAEWNRSGDHSSNKTVLSS
jgi:2'-hydroxyisoflavone reductase